MKIQCLIVTLLGFVASVAFAGDGYYISLYYAAPPTANCSAQFNNIRNTVYKGYVDEMVYKSNVTYQEVDDVDPDWFDHRRLKSRSLRRNIDSDRRLTNCSPTQCSKGAYTIALLGCTNCRRRNLAAHEERFLLDSPDSTRPWGNKTVRVKDNKGSNVVSQFYQNVDYYIDSKDPCKLILGSLLYQINGLKFDK